MPSKRKGDLGIAFPIVLPFLLCMQDPETQVRGAARHSSFAAFHPLLVAGSTLKETICTAQSLITAVHPGMKHNSSKEAHVFSSFRVLLPMYHELRMKDVEKAPAEPNIALLSLTATSRLQPPPRGVY